MVFRLRHSHHASPKPPSYWGGYRKALVTPSITGGPVHGTPDNEARALSSAGGGVDA